MMIALACLVIGALGAWFMSRYAFALGLVDEPNLRSSHVTPTPRGGGVGLLVAFVLSALVLRAPWAYWLPAAMLSVVSFFDDRLDLSARIRLVFQFSAAIVAILFLKVSMLNSMILILFVPVLAVYVVGTTNFFNFMDGINGIAGITGVVAFGALAWFGWANGLESVKTLLPLCLACACLGFLPFNLPAARVFLGDIGSVLLGFVYALTVVWFAEDLPTFLCLAGFLFPFYLDTLSTLYVRWRDGERLSQAHRRHLYQLLANERNIAHWKVAAAYGVLQTVFAILMVLAWRGNLAWQLGLGVVFSAAFVSGSWKIRTLGAKV